MKNIGDFLNKYGIKVSHPFRMDGSNNCFGPFNRIYDYDNKDDKYTCWRVDLKVTSPYLTIRNGSSDYSPSILPHVIFGQVIELLNSEQIVVFSLHNPWFYFSVDIEDILSIGVYDSRHMAYLIDNIGRK